jgi:late competence protein required for DNA uptake (superfamily II DNA/RNA helicase)
VNIYRKKKKEEMEEEKRLKRSKKEISGISNDRDRCKRPRRYREILAREAKIKASSVSIYCPSCKNRGRVDKSLKKQKM